MTTQSTRRIRFFHLALTLISSLLVVRPAAAARGERPPAASFHHAPATLWIAPHVGAFGMSRGRLRPIGRIAREMG